MKTYLLLILPFITFIACSPNGSDEASTEENTTKEDTEVVEESVTTVDDVITFNNNLVSHTDMAEVQITQLMELDDQDVESADMTALAEKVKSDIQQRIEELKHTTVSGNGGEEFLNAAIHHLNTVNQLADIYIKFADNLAIPDSLWDEEMGNAWLNDAEPVFKEYENSYASLEMAQGNYSALNDKDLIPSYEKSLEEMQEDLK